MTVLGISVDDAAASRRLAAREHIRFPLLADATLEVSRAYVGVDDHELSVPGVVLVRPDGTIAYRHISDDKADRPTLRALLAEIDRAFGPPAETVGLHGGFAPIERLQVGLALGGGAVRLDDGWHGGANARLSALWPLGRHLLAGGSVGGEAVRGRLDVDGALAARLPFYADLAELQLIGLGGYSAGDLHGWHAGARLALGFAATPSWAFQLALGGTALRLGDQPVLETALTLQVTRLFRVR